MHYCMDDDKFCLLYITVSMMIRLLCYSLYVGMVMSFAISSITVRMISFAMLCNAVWVVKFLPCFA